MFLVADLVVSSLERFIHTVGCAQRFGREAIGQIPSGGVNGFCLVPEQVQVGAVVDFTLDEKGPYPVWPRMCMRVGFT